MLDEMFTDPDNPDPAEGWAVIERFARAELPQTWAKISKTLKAIEALASPDVLLPDESALVKLVALLSVLNAHAERYCGSCATVRDMMSVHYRCFPKWEGPKQLQPKSGA